MRAGCTVMELFCSPSRAASPAAPSARLQHSVSRPARRPSLRRAIAPARGVATDGRRDYVGGSSSTSGGSEDGLSALREQFGIDDFIEVSPGRTGAPEVTLNHPNGSSATVDLRGARVTSWTKPSGKELLYCPGELGQYGFTGVTPCSGGVSLAFPQFGEGLLPRDGLLQDLQWELVGSELGEYDERRELDPAPGICMRACDTAATRKRWPFSFQVEYQVNLMEMDDFPPEFLGPHFADPQWEEKYDNPNPYLDAPDEGEESPASQGKRVPDTDETHIWSPDEIEQQLRFLVLIKNTDDKPFKFTTGVRPQLATKNLQVYGQYVRVLGLGGKYCLDYVNTACPRLRVLNDDFLTFREKEMDSVIVDVFGDADVMFCPGDRSYLSIHNREGFKDIAAWHPKDSLPLQADDFVSLGSARVARAVTLQPGEEWYGEVAYRSHDIYWDQMPAFKRNTGIFEGIEHPPHHIGLGEED